MIVAEADRVIDPLKIIRRTIQFGFKHYPDLGREGHMQRAIDHLKEKKVYIHPLTIDAAKWYERRAVEDACPYIILYTHC